MFLDAVGLGIGFVDLVDGDDDRHLRGLRVIDGFDGLRHDSVVGGDDDDHDVGDFGTASTHAGERFVAGGVEEYDLASVGGR